MPYPATSPGPGFQEAPHALQETPHGRHAEEWPKAAHNTSDADREEKDGEHKAEDPRHQWMSQLLRRRPPGAASDHRATVIADVS